jgi:epoxyqueuosine reductase
MNGWMFGCDICQDVCPWNRFAQPHHESMFTPIPEVLDLTAGEWNAMTEDVFRKVFKTSPMSRPKWKGIQRNLKAIKQQ